MIRYVRLVGLMLAAWLFSNAAPAAYAQTAPGLDLAAATSERVLGNKDAKVHLIEYASMTCPHCAHFHEAILPKFKADFIDTGLVKLEFRDFPLDKWALTASQVLRCVPAERFFALQSVLFKAQRSWATASDPLQALRTTSRIAGLGDAQFDACVNSIELRDSVIRSRQTGEQQFQIDGTPYFTLANGRKVEPFGDYDAMVKSLEKLGIKKPAK